MKLHQIDVKTIFLYRDLRGAVSNIHDSPRGFQVIKKNTKFAKEKVHLWMYVGIEAEILEV